MTNNYGIIVVSVMVLRNCELLWIDHDIAHICMLKYYG